MNYVSEPCPRSALQEASPHGLESGAAEVHSAAACETLGATRALRRGTRATTRPRREHKNSAPSPVAKIKKTLALLCQRQLTLSGVNERGIMQIFTCSFSCRVPKLNSKLTFFFSLLLPFCIGDEDNVKTTIAHLREAATGEGTLASFC